MPLKLTGRRPATADARTGRAPLAPNEAINSLESMQDQFRSFQRRQKSNSNFVGFYRDRASSSSSAAVSGQKPLAFIVPNPIPTARRDRVVPPKSSQHTRQELAPEIHIRLESHSFTACPKGEVKKDAKNSLKRFLNGKVFMRLLECPETRDELRAWLERHEPLGPGILKLDRFTDEYRLIKLTDILRQHYDELGRLFRENQPAADSIGLPQEIQEESARELVNVASGLDYSQLMTSQKWLASSLYKSEFQRFIISKLVARTRSQLARSPVMGDHSGLGDSFVLIDPSLKNFPMVMISAGFTVSSGCELHQIIGRRWNFQADPETSEKSVNHIQKAIREEKSFVELLINYRRDGSAFYCLLSVVPLFDKNGKVIYVFSGQVNVTGEFDSFEKLTSLILSEPARQDTNGSPMNGSVASVATPMPPSAEQRDVQEPLLSQSFFPHHTLSDIPGNLYQPRKLLDPKAVDKKLDRKPVPFEWLATIGRRKWKQDELLRDNSNSDFRVHSVVKNGGAQIQQLIETCESPSPRAEVQEKHPASRNTETLPTAELEVTESFPPTKEMETHPTPGIAAQGSTIEFVGTYPRVLIFGKSSYRIICATSPALAYFGLSTGVAQGSHSARIYTKSFVELVSGHTPSHTENLRAQIINAIQKDLTVSCQCVLSCASDIPQPVHTLGKKSRGHTLSASQVHLTPLVDSSGKPSLYVAVIG